MRVRRGIIGMKRAEAALLSTFTAGLNTSHRKLLPLTDDGLSEFLFATGTVCLPGFKFQVDGGKELLIDHAPVPSSWCQPLPCSVPTPDIALERQVIDRGHRCPFFCKSKLMAKPYINPDWTSQIFLTIALNPNMMSWAVQVYPKP